MSTAVSAVRSIAPEVQDLSASSEYTKALSLIERLHRALLAGDALCGICRSCDGFHHDTSPVVVLSTYSTKLVSRPIGAT